MPEDALEATLSPLLEDVVEPLAGDSPVGEDVSYDDDFLSLKDDVDQLSSVNPEGVDYERIVESCRAILGRKSKDLRVATYLALALSRTAGYQGILDGLLAQKLLVERFWEPMFPPIRRMKARQNAFQFSAERLTETLRGLKPRAGDRQSIEAALETLKALQAFTMESMGEEAPVLSGLARALEEALRKVPKEQTAEASKSPLPSGDAAPSAPATPEASSVPQSTAAPSAPADVQTESEALEHVLGLAGFLREQAHDDPTSYRLARCVRWDAITAEPTNQGGKTMFQDPAPHRLTYLNTLLEGKEWKTLLDVAEEAFRELPFHFWLDLQRFVAAALEGLGGEYAAARQSVILETALLVKRVRTLPQLTFSGGAPFADAKTKFWLEDTVAPVLASGSSNATAGDDQELTGQFDEAKRLAAAGKLAEAIGVLQDGLQHDAARRGRFFRRYYMAQICMQADKPAVARPILEQLEAEIDAFALHEWEPNLAMDVWSQLHQCYGLLPADDETTKRSIEEQSQRVFARICQVDAARALDR